MLAGNSMFPAEAVPSIPHGHGLGHSRGRGHSRRSTPISQSVSYAPPTVQQLPEQSGTEEHGLNGYDEASKYGGHRHSHSHSHSHSHHEHDLFEPISLSDKPSGIQAETTPKQL